MAGIASAPPQRMAKTFSARKGEFAIHPAHVRALLWLRLRLTLRRYTRSGRAIIGLLFTLALFIGGGAALGVITGSEYQSLPRAAASQMLFGVVGLLYVIWALLPLLQYTVNEGLDVTKLQAYPVTRGEQMVSLTLATLFDVSAFVILGLYVAIFVGWRATPLAATITVIALIFAYIHTVALTQLILAALMGLLRSRRYRDITIIFFALLGSLFSVGEQFLIRRGLSFGDPASLAALRLGTYLRWTPPGMAAQAIILADNDQYALSVVWLVGSLVLIPIVLTVWSLLLERGITNAESSGQPTRRRRSRMIASVGEATVSVSTPARTRRSLFSGPVSAIANKEIRYLWRDPQLKATLLSPLFLIIFVLVPGLYGTGRAESVGSGGGAWSVLLAPLPALLLVLVFSINALGMERQGLQTLFLFPVRPLDIFWGKNVVIGSMAFAVELVLVVIKSVMAQDWFFAPLALVGGLAAILVMLGCGNVSSVVAPFRWRQLRMGDTSTMSTENGCLRSVVQLGVMGVTVVLLIPVVLAIGLPLALSHHDWLFFLLPLALLYGVAFHQAATRIIAPFLLRRAPELLASVAREA